MMDVQLSTWLMLDHATGNFSNSEIVTQFSGGSRHRYTYADFFRRTCQLMHALDSLGVGKGERVATLAWNNYRHLEAYFAIPCTERVVHTLNARLSPEDLAYVADHAEDRAILVEPDLLPLLEKARSIGGLRDVRAIVVLADEVPDADLSEVVGYEDWIADHPSDYPRREIPESAPCGLCYTSGTTGRPKGVLYTHRSTYLHALTVSSGAGMGIGPGDCTLSVVPMFHANAWGMPHASTLVGAKHTYLSGNMDPASLVDLLATERVTITAGVPTVWLTMADELARRDERLPDLRTIICGGSQPPQSLIERYRRDFDLTVVQAWGMTETSPVASIAWPKEEMRDWDEADLVRVVRTRAGLPLPAVQTIMRDDEGNTVPWDGRSMGQLLVRGPWVADSYLGGDGADQFTEDGWFKTGDIAVGHPEGYFVIADRTKDLIKSGGEWISSVDMEAAIMAMPGVVEAAVVAVPDPKWQERPLAFVVPASGQTVEIDAVRDHLQQAGFAKWQLPDRLEIIEEIPRTSVGKFDKKVLRSRLSTA